MAAESGRKLDLTKIVLYASAALVATVLGVALSILVFGPPAGAAGARPFTLVDHRGDRVDESVLEGQIDLVYFGYTYCPDVCPVELNNLALAIEQARERGSTARLVFVSVDAQRDTPAVLAEYVGYFGDDVLGLTGTAAQVKAAADQYGAIYYRHGGSGGDDYLVSHTNYVYVVDADGDYAGYFSGGEAPDAVVDRVLAMEAGAR